MAEAARIYWLHALSPLHVGMGRGDGYIDLPLLREKVTNWPIIPGSSTKGVFADSCQARKEVRDPKSNDAQYKYSRELHAAFGHSGTDIANAGALLFSDARIACLAVRSLYGTFAWCTSPLVLQRLARDLAAAGCTNSPSAPLSVAVAHVPVTQQNTADSYLISGGKLYLEDLDIDAQACSTATAWAKHLAQQVFADRAWHDEFVKRFAVLPDDIFNHLASTATEVQAHVRIDPDFKRVAKGQLWYEESLPAESILSGIVWCDDPSKRVQGVTKKEVIDLLQDRVVQMGGKATTGKGQVQLRFQPIHASANDQAVTAGANP